MDNVTKLLIDIKDLLEKEEKRGHLYFPSGLLNDLANILEKDGFGVARTFLLDKLTKGRDKPQANVLMRIIDMLEHCHETRSRRSIGRNIIKSLITLRKTEVGRYAD